MFFDDREKSSFALLSLIIKKQHLTEKSHEYERLSIKSIFFFWKQQQNRTNGCSLIMSDSDTLIVKILPFLKENVSFFPLSISITWIEHIYHFQQLLIFLLCCSIAEKSLLITE